MRAIILLGLLAFASPAAAAEQFGLSCTKHEYGNLPERTGRSYRIDLKSMRWCQDDCQQVYEIKKVTPDRITLLESDVADRDVRFLHFIDRGMGTYTDLYEAKSLGLRMLIEGRCEATSFAGFPATKF